MLHWSGARRPARVLDVGCGIGGTSRHLAARFPHAHVQGAALAGLTAPQRLLSPKGLSRLRVRANASWRVSMRSKAARGQRACVLPGLGVALPLDAMPTADSRDGILQSSKRRKCLGCERERGRTVQTPRCASRGAALARPAARLQRTGAARSRQRRAEVNCQIMTRTAQ